MNTQPTIRPGQYKPYVKATRRQIDERVGFVARLLRAGRTKTQIHRAVKARFGVEWRQCDRYISQFTRVCSSTVLSETNPQSHGSHASFSGGSAPVRSPANPR
jgi:hypothetical protein